jgi:hypothetical protein
MEEEGEEAMPPVAMLGGKRPRTDPVPLAQFDDNQHVSGKPFLSLVCSFASSSSLSAIE